MAKKRSSKRRETKTFFRFQSLHQDVCDAVADEVASPWFNEEITSYEDSDKKNYNNEYSTYVMGKFSCRNNRCSQNGWGSKKVCILIRGYPGNGYTAFVFNQSCKSCDQLGTMTLDENSYVERVAYRLKKWAGVQMDTGGLREGRGPPHESSFCEGCKRDFCLQGGSNRQVSVGGQGKETQVYAF